MPVRHDLTLREFFQQRCDMTKFSANKHLFKNSSQVQSPEEESKSGGSGKMTTFQFEILFLMENFSFDEQMNQVD